MRYRPLGRSGLTVSVVGLGCNNLGWVLDVAATRKVYHEPDGITPVEETLAALDELVRAGKVRAAGLGLEMLDVAIGGLAAQPAVASVIAGATSPEQVRANARAGEWQPTPDDLAALDGVTPPGRG